MSNPNLMVPWLNAAHAMEKAQLPILEAHARQAQDHPLIAARLEEHLEQTRNHVLAMEGCVGRLAHPTSTVKAHIGTLLGTLQVMSSGVLGDAVVRNFLAGYAAEKYEIGVYRALIALASEMGDAETAEVCQRILREEEDMARWIEEQIPTVVRETLRLRSASH